MMDFMEDVIERDDLIPHQVGLVRDQAKKLMKGDSIVLPYKQMGAHAGEHVMLLLPQNARKLLTAYKKGKGMKLHLTPMEIQHTIQRGQGFRDVAKKVFTKGKELVQQALKNPVIKQTAKSALKKGAEAVGTAIGSYLGNPDVGRQIGYAVGEAGAAGIEAGDVAVSKAMLANRGKEAGLNLARQELKEQIQQNVPVEARAAARLALEQAYAKAKETTGEEDIKRLGLGVKRPKMVKGSKEAKEYMAMIRAKKGKGIGSDILSGLKTVGKYGIPATTSALGGIAGAAATGGNPMGGIAGSAAGAYGGDQLVKKLGLGMRPRGRPRKVVGMGASMSMAYKQALRNNYGGLTLHSQSEENAPVSSFRVNPKVRPSGSEMTLSPYQRLDSPAMNPFIPTYYIQQGGTSSGYGGRGLYTSAGRGLY
jgi:hypothetical protein